MVYNFWLASVAKMRSNFEITKYADNGCETGDIPCQKQILD